MPVFVCSGGCVLEAKQRHQAEAAEARRGDPVGPPVGPFHMGSRNLHTSLRF